MAGPEREFQYSMYTADMVAYLHGLMNGEIPENTIRFLIKTVSCALNRTIPREEAARQLVAVVGENELTQGFLTALVNAIPDDPLKPICTDINEIYPLKPQMLTTPRPPLSHRRRSGGRRAATGWDAEEDRLLIAAVQKHNGRNWKLIAQEVGSNRTPDQCSQHWFRVLDPHIRKGKWSKEEDNKLLAAVYETGPGCWKDIAERMEGRTDIQVRYRYARLMRNRRE